MSNEFTHFDSKGNAIMVDVTEKQKTERVAVAVGKIKVSKETLDLMKGIKLAFDPKDILNPKKLF